MLRAHRLYILIAVTAFVSPFATADVPAEAGPNIWYPTADTSTLLPGPACPYPDGEDGNAVADHNYGGSGSRSIASATARAYSPSEGIDHEPKGLFQSILRFDTAGLPAESIDSLSLYLYTLNGNTSAFDLYNYRGSAGWFTVSLVYDGWPQGNGTPHDGLPTIADPLVTDAYETDSLTHNNLEAMLADHEPVALVDLYYDAAVPYADGAAWYAFDLSDALAIPEFAAALASGETFSLLLSPTDLPDNDVAFNFTARNQTSSTGGNKTRDDSVLLSYTTVPEPTSVSLLVLGALASFRRQKE